MYKYREIVYDIMSDLQQVNDDRKITPYHVLWYVSTIGSSLLKQHLDNEYARTGRMSGRYLTVFPSVQVQTFQTGATNIVPGRKVVKLPGILLDFDFERAVSYVSYTNRLDTNPPSFQTIQFERTTPTVARTLNATFETPTSSNPYFYVVNKYVYFLGLENLNVEEVEMGLFLAVDPRGVAGMDDDCPLPPHLIQQLKYQIINLGRFVMSVPVDNVNDGNDTTASAPAKEKIENEQQ